MITGVADRALPRIAHLVFVDSGPGRNGHVVGEGEVTQQARKQGHTVNGIEVVVGPDSPSTKLFGVSKPEDVAFMKGKITVHPRKAYEQPLRMTNEAAMMKIPRTFMRRPATTPLEGPAKPSANEPAPVRRDAQTWEIDTGHDMMITTPQAVTDILIDVAASL